MGGEVDLTTGEFVQNEKGNVKLNKVKLAPQGIDVWNPSFDVTPHQNIDCIVTEDKFIVKNSNGEFDLE
ncbi:unnamed protein product [Ambrosiozyma monospora]|uniref:Unnamed protein product n=1 Tax=Ambrosiozyma monospora TaxID=43982 RepID=A0ACB5SZW6_AMBMO|nr:unnamed protein product [Ambrosiozyma monospora]